MPNSIHSLLMMMSITTRPKTSPGLPSFSLLRCLIMSLESKHHIWPSSGPFIRVSITFYFQELFILIANLRIQIETFFHIKLELDNYPTFYYFNYIFSLLYSSLKVDEIKRRNEKLSSDTVNEKVPNNAKNFNENGIIEIIVHPVFNAINQLFKQSPSSIKSLMDVALSQSDSNGFNSKTVTMRLE